MTLAQTLQIVTAMLAVLLPPIIGAVVIIVQQRIAQLPTAQRVRMENVARTVVTAVEQGAAIMSPNEKKALAVGQLKNIAGQLGMKVDDQSASTFIESAVYQLKSAESIAKVAWLNTPNQPTV